MAILLITFFVLLLCGIPVTAVMGIASMSYLVSAHMNVLTVSQRMFAGADNFTLMAIPLFMFAAIV
ncbi:MAG: TRAP transporter large permease subunit [Lachnospiraceae bacterium]|nr:TRAP transporter large permease subunit [Lachnospiraceae bacterium]MCI9134673.1 TRAP transporter large permease subunit [Lachnospiraceae bacterium]